MKKFIIPVLSFFLIFSCDMIPFFEEEEKEDDQPTKMENILDDYSRSLEGVLTEDQIELLVTDAKEQVGDQESEDPEVIIPTAVETLIASLSTVTELTAEKRIEVIDTITEESVTIINNELGSQSRNTRAVDLTKLKSILNKVAKSIVKSVPKCGLDKTDYSSANESCLETLVSTLDEADIEESNIVELTETVTEGAVSQIKESESDYSDIKEDIVKSISQGAVKGIVNIESVSVGKDDLVQSITKAALNAVSELETDSATITILIVVVTDGTTAGINDIKSQLNAEDITSAIQTISKETVESVNNLDITDEEKKAKVTELSTEINDKVAENLVDVDTTEAIKAVVSGIASGAQEVSSEFSDIDTVLNAIDIKDDSGNTIDLEEYTEDIQSGIDAGLEEKEAEADETEKFFIEAIGLVHGVIKDDLNSINSTITSLETVITSHPDHELVGELKFYLANLYRTKFLINNSDDANDQDIVKAIEYAQGAIGDYSILSWYVFESIILLSDIYKYDIKEFELAINILANVEELYSGQPIKVLRSNYEELATYRQQWYTENDEMKVEGTEKSFLENTLIPKVNAVLTEATSLIDYSHPEGWILKEVIKSKADSLIWLGDFEGALLYLEEQIAILEEATLDPNMESIAKANLYFIAGKLFYQKGQEWGDDKQQMDDAAIEALLEAEDLAWNNGIILDEWLYVDITGELLSAIAQKSASMYFYSKEDIPQEFFHLINKIEEIGPRVRNLGNDTSGQFGRLLSFIREGTLFKNIGRELKGFNDELAERYLDHSIEILTAAFDAFKNDLYYHIDDWAASDLLVSLTEAIYAQYGFEEALLFVEENIALYEYEQWALGPIFLQIYEELNQRAMFTYYNSNGLTENEMKGEFNALKYIADAYYEAMIEIITTYDYEWYVDNIRAYGSKFYYMYFYFIKGTTDSTTDAAIIDARMKAADLGPGDPYTGDVINNEDLVWYNDLFTEDSNLYGGVILEGGINVTIK